MALVTCARQRTDAPVARAKAFRNKDKIKTSYEATPKGTIVTKTSDDRETVAALQKHAAEVSDLVRRGMAAAHETMRNRGMGRGAAAGGEHRH